MQAGMHDLAEAGGASHEPWSGAERREWLEHALERLPSEQRLVLELAYHLGHSCEEIAEIMNCPVNTVKTRMFHARKKAEAAAAGARRPAAGVARMSSDSAPGGKHAIMWELIPWLVNGRLMAQRPRRCKAHMESCAECAREYAQQLHIFEAMQADESIAFASEASFQKLAARLDAAPRSARAPANVAAALGRRREHRCCARIGCVGRLDPEAHPCRSYPPPIALSRRPPPSPLAATQLRVVFTPNLTLSELERACCIRSMPTSATARPRRECSRSRSLPGATLRLTSRNASPHCARMPMCASRNPSRPP
jgi:hypothetical protein